MSKPKPLDLLGVVSSFAGDATKEAMKYGNTNKNRAFTSFVVVPGLYSLSSKMLKRNSNIIAVFLSPGDREDKMIMMGFKSKNTYKYVGTRSGTNANVSNALLEAWIKRKNQLTNVNDSSYYRLNLGTPTVIGQANYDRANVSDHIYINEYLYTVISAVSQIIAIGLLITLIVTTSDIKAIALTVSNMASYMMIITSVAYDNIIIPNPTPAIGVEEGNIIITNNSNEDIWIINGNENTIQSVAQKEIKGSVNIVRDYFELMASLVGIITSIATILLTPLMSHTGQILFAAQMCIGLLNVLVFASRNGERIAEGLINYHYNVSDVKKTRFTNRAAAIAASVIVTKGFSKNISAYLVPLGKNWNDYRDILDYINVDIRGNTNSVTHNKIKDYFTNTSNLDKVQAATLIADNIPIANNLMPHDRSNNEEYDKWPHRLIIDIAEALRHFYSNISSIQV